MSCLFPYIPSSVAGRNIRLDRNGQFASCNGVFKVSVQLSHTVYFDLKPIIFHVNLYDIISFSHFTDKQIYRSPICKCKDIAKHTDINMHSLNQTCRTDCRRNQNTSLECIVQTRGSTTIVLRSSEELCCCLSLWGRGLHVNLQADVGLFNSCYKYVL